MMRRKALQRAPENEQEIVDSGPTRRCIVTRVILPKAAMLRFVLSPDGAVTPDLEARLPGRGLYVLPKRDALERAIEKGAFSRAAKAPVRTPDALAEQVVRLLERRCVDLISLARKAGQAVAGLEKVKAWLVSGQAAILMAAADGAEDGRRRLRRLSAAADGPPEIAVLDAASLGAAFGRDHVVHAALAHGTLADRLRTDAERLKGMLVGGQV